jgi:hypothetical protein
MGQQIQKMLEDKNLNVDSHPNYDYIVHQWVAKVNNFSSEYNGWPATNVQGKPNTFPNYGDIRTAWAPLKSKGQYEFLELQYSVPVHILSVHVYETYNPGSLVKISSKPNSNEQEWDTIWTGEKEHSKIPEQSRINKIDCCQHKYETNLIRLDFDTNGARSWSEVDAVELIGYLYDYTKKRVFDKMLANKKEFNIYFTFH